MARSKAHLFKEDEIRIAQFARALGHPARVAILKTLSKQTDCVCGEIVDDLPLAQATVSQHLSELKSLGLIDGEVDGPKSCYCINWKAMDRYAKLLDHFLERIRTNHEQCCP